MRFAHKVNKSLMSEGFRELMWTCPLCSYAGKIFKNIRIQKGKFIMICNKCGAQCDDNQAFCLKCGNPIQLTADFNLIEKELASNIDELMNEIEANGENKQDFDDVPKTINVSSDKINMELKVMDISRNEEKSDINNIEDYDDNDEDVNKYQDYEEDDDIIEIVPLDLDEDDSGKRNKSNIEKKNTRQVNKNKPKGKSNNKIAVILGCIAVVAVIIAVLFVFVINKDSDEPTVKTFNDYYTSAEASYNAGDMDKSLEEAYEALRNIKSNADEIKARKLIHKIYTSQNFSASTYIENVEKLVALGDTSEDYYSILVKKYAEEKNTELLMTLMEKIGVDKAKEYFGESFVESPTSNMESGEYINVVAFKLSAKEGCKIYYCINDDITKNPIEYTNEIIIKNIGEQVVTVYAVSEQGIPSFVEKYTYNVTEGETEGPIVTPSSGIYTEPTQITIQIPEGGKVYYTYTKDGEKPTQASTEYKEPVEMLMDAEIFMAIAVDKYGNISEVTKRQYKFKLKRKETLTSGKDKVWSFYTGSGKIDAEGKLEDGSVMTIDYEDAAIIDNAEYYIYRAVTSITNEDSTVTTTGITYVAVNTYDGIVVEGLVQAGDEFVLPELKEKK